MKREKYEFSTSKADIRTRSPTLLFALLMVLLACTAFSAIKLETLAIGTPKVKDDRVNFGIYVVGDSGSNSAALIQSEIAYDAASFSFDASTVKAANAAGKLTAYDDNSLIKYYDDSAKGFIKISYCEAALANAIKITSEEACVFSFQMKATKDSPTAAFTSSNQKYYGFSGSTPANANVSTDQVTKTVKKGDVNMNGRMNIDDAISIIDYLGWAEDFSDKQIQIGDVNLNGKMNIDDAIKMVDDLSKYGFIN